MIRITKASDPITVEQLITVIYSPPGQGKTSLAFTADKPLLLDFDEGSYRSANRGDTVIARSWNDAANITAEDLEGYRTLVIDTAGRALDKLAVDVIKQNPKHGRSGGALTLQGYGELKARFIAFLKMVRSLGLDIVLVAHSDEQRGNSDDLIERIDISGGSKAEIYKVADAMGRLSIKNGQRTLNFSPTDTTFGKNPAGLPPLEVPDFKKNPRFLADVVQSIKDKLNESSAASLAEQARLDELKASLEHLESAEQFTAEIPKLAKASPKDKALLISVADAKGFALDKKAKIFVAKAAA